MTFADLVPEGAEGLSAEEFIECVRKADKIIAANPIKYWLGGTAFDTYAAFEAAGIARWRRQWGPAELYRRDFRLAHCDIEKRPGRHRIKPRPVWFNPEA